MSVRGVKCFICIQKGHMAKSCPEARKNPAQMVVLEGSGPETSDATGQPSDNTVKQQPDDVE